MQKCGIFLVSHQCVREIYFFVGVMQVLDKVWFCVLMFSLLIEIVTVQLISIWFCVGAAVALIASWCGVQSSIQIILFVAVSGLCLAFIYPPIAKSIKKRTQNLKTLLQTMVQDKLKFWERSGVRNRKIRRLNTLRPGRLLRSYR